MQQTETSNISEQVFEIQHLYVKEQSCKMLYGSSIFSEEWKPNIQLEIDVKHEPLANQLYEIVLLVNAVAKNQQRTAFTVEVKQAGIFKIVGLSDEQLQILLKVHCPSILYPYARKVVASATMDAGFPPLTLVPINFEGIYRQQQQADAATSETLKESALVETSH